LTVIIVISYSVAMTTDKAMSELLKAAQAAPALPTADTSKSNPLAIDLSASDLQVGAARTIVTYGDSGLGKSTNAKFFAQYEYELTGKPVRLIAAEDSSKTIFEPLINIGVVEPLFITKVKQPLVMLRRLSRGEWPVEQKSGTISWEPMESWRDKIGAYVLEGLSSMSEALLEEFREEHRFLREQKADSYEISGEKVATSSQTSYGVAQAEMLKALRAFGMMPVDRVLWTAHENKGSESGTGLPIRGPGLVGSAGTDLVRKYCGLLLHFDSVKVNGSEITRVFFVKHSDPIFPNISYPAKTTIPSEKVDELLKLFPGGYFDPGKTYGTGLDRFLRAEAKLVAEQTESLAAWKASIPVHSKLMT
jgi:hypothetical protein